MSDQCRLLPPLLASSLTIAHAVDRARWLRFSHGYWLHHTFIKASLAPPPQRRAALAAAAVARLHTHHICKRQLSYPFFNYIYKDRCCVRFSITKTCWNTPEPVGTPPSPSATLVSFPRCPLLLVDLPPALSLGAVQFSNGGKV